MNAYQVLARRWRPQRFEDLVGQDVVVRSLRNAISSGEIAHAYLFSGLRGVGKTTAARLLAKALNCDNGPTPDPCGSCVPCQEIAAGSALDVLEIDAASNRGIDDVRELREVARVLPVRDRYRVFIVDEAHQLTDAAFNALLKILEEPPPHVVFVLASTERQKFPATILSRCQQLDFRPIPADTIAAHLRTVADGDELALSAGAARLLARAAEGSLRDALSLLDRVHAFASDGVTEESVAEVLGLPPTDLVLQLFDAVTAGDVAAVLAALRTSEDAGNDPVAVYDGLVQLLHTMLLLCGDPSAPIGFAEGDRPALTERASRLGIESAVRLLGLAIEQRSLVVGVDHPGLAVSVAVGRLAMWPRVQRVEELLAGEPPTPGGAAGGGPRAGGGRGPDPSSRSGSASASPDRQRGRQAESPPPPSAGSLRERLAEALEHDGTNGLAARVLSASDVEARDGALLIHFASGPSATVKAVRAGADRIARTAARLGLPSRVEVVGGSGDASDEEALRSRVEAHEGVRNVLEVFGGRIERIEEKP